ncbi:hypothetical protein [Clostridium minihomine]|uniref:hypothetical protein n=1 Tax=Clostridium minihomine TaxID=2045012 RepID=UPI000C758D50|nr:hypothetical protein [Clostridium minihomine]
MHLDIQAIADEKIISMHKSGQIQKQLEDDIEKLVLKSIDNALDGYKIRSAVEDSVSKSVSDVLNKIDFTTYNGFIAEKVKELTEGALRNDVAQKIQQSFNQIFIKKHDKIKLSEIFKRYREWLCDTTEDEEKYSLESFFAEMNDREPEYSWIDFTLSKEKQERYSSYKDDDYFRFTVHRGYKEPRNIGWISTVTFGDTPLDKALRINPNKFQAFIMNLVYNKTSVEIDIDNEDDIDCSFDIDI